MPLKPTIVQLTTTGADIQAALTALGAAGGGILQLGPGTYYPTSTLTFPDNVAVRLIGSGEAVTVLNFRDLSATTDCIKIRGGFSSLESMSVVGQNVAGIGKLIVVGSPTVSIGYVQLSRLFVYGSAAEAIYFEGTEAGHGQITLGNRVVDCKIRQNNQAGAVGGSMVHIGQGCTTIHFSRCAFDNFKSVCVSDYSGSAGYGNTFDRCSFDAPADNLGDWIRLSGTLHSKFLGCTFENTTANHAYYKIRAMNGCTGVSIQDCNVITNQGWELCFALGYGSVVGSVDVGARLVNNWLHTNTASSGATNIVFGTPPTETCYGHVVEGGGVREYNNPNIVYQWDSFITDSSGGMFQTDLPGSTIVSYEDDYVMYDDAVVTY